MNKLNTYRAGVDEDGHFGIYGGRYVAETLMPLILEVEKAWNNAKEDDDFWTEFNHYMKHYVGRPSPLYLAARLTEHLGGAKIYLKRDELNHTGAHKINNTIGQILLARRMGKRRIIAETGAGQHGVRRAGQRAGPAQRGPKVRSDADQSHAPDVVHRCRPENHVGLHFTVRRGRLPEDPPDPHPQDPLRPGRRPRQGPQASVKGSLQEHGRGIFPRGK